MKLDVCDSKPDWADYLPKIAPAGASNNTDWDTWSPFSGAINMPTLQRLANHAPQHAPQEYIAKYKGKFDKGYEAYRQWVLPRMIAKGIIPAGTDLNKLNPMPPGISNLLSLHQINQNRD